MRKMRDFLQQNSGAAAIEYGLIAGGIALVIMAVIFALGGQVSDSLIFVADAIAAL